MPKITIRAGEGDIPAVVALYRQRIRRWSTCSRSFLCCPAGDEFVRQAVKTADADYLLAEEDGAVVGFALGELCGVDAGVQLCAAPSLRLPGGPGGRRSPPPAGHWHTLLGAAKRWARDRRLEYLELSVCPRTPPPSPCARIHDFVERHGLCGVCCKTISANLHLLQTK